jgi:cyclophilin family peptidyl-prolyl cis-trans isomerase
LPGTIVQFTFSGFPDGSTSNVNVQLFDHDKPATVQNFIHYIRSSAYTNMFFERCIPGFILQGGSYGASNRTDTNPPIYGWDISSMFTKATNQNPPFPPQVASEFNVGPLIHNRFGTVAMALYPNDQNSAASGFFFNLADNSGSPNYLDTQNGGFTVFGQILDGTNVLEYFNTLGIGSGVVTNAEFLDEGVLNTNQLFPNLPVNYTGTNGPANANLVFCDFGLTNPPVDTTPPTVAVTSFTATMPLTNSLQGTASDNLGLAVVLCVLTPQAAADGTYPYPYTNGAIVTNYADGTSNWSLSLNPGSYSVSVQSQDGAGNLSQATNLPVTNTAIVVAGNGTVTLTNGAFTNLNAVGYPFQNNVNYNVMEIPGTNQVFVNWANDAATNINSGVSFTMSDGFVVTATFISNAIPNSIAFTYPEANSTIGLGTFNITGTISNDSSTPVTVTCTLFSQPDGFSASPPLTSTGTTNWSVTVSNLPSGSYSIEAMATDAAGESTVIVEDFTVSTNAYLQLNIVGLGTVSGVTNGELLPLGTNFQVTAIPGPGQAFYTWNNGTQSFGLATQTFTMVGGLTLTATFIPTNTARGISFTYPPANALLSTNTFTLIGRATPRFRPANITCQIFQVNGLAVGPPLMTTGTATWSAAVTNLMGGNYIVKAVATNAAGLSTIISERFFVLAFAAAAGTYSGLFISTNSPVAATNSGFLTFTVDAYGIFSGRLVFPAYAPIPIYSLIFENIEFSVGSNQFGFADFYGRPLNGTIYLDLSGGTGVALGTISSTAWSSQLLCYRAVTKLSTNTTPATGNYVLNLQPGNPTNGLNTNGYVSLAAAKNGVLALSGALPDNTTFSQSARVSKEGAWPLYGVPAGDNNKGMLLGWEFFSNSGNCNGQLYWYKAPHVGAYYTEGVGVVSNLLLTSTGTNYSQPVAGGQYSIIFEGGTIVPPLTNTLTVNDAGQFIVSGGATDKLKISLSARGVISGSILNTNDNKTLHFKGAFTSPAQGGSGFIPEPDGLTGCFALKLAPP